LDHSSIPIDRQSVASSRRILNSEFRGSERDAAGGRRRGAMGGEVKPGSRGLKSWAQRHLNVGFAVGFLLVLLTYLVVSRQLAVTAPGGKRIQNSPLFRSLRGAGLF